MTTESPLRGPLLESLRDLADELAPAKVVVVGATALRHHMPGRARATLDVDLAIDVAVGDRVALAGLRREPPPRQRWFDSRNHPIDIVPASRADLDRGYVQWADGVEMSLCGFDLVMDGAAKPSPESPDNLLVADLVALFVCKIVACRERAGDRGEKDLPDIALILENYVAPDDDRFHDVPPPDYDFDARAAFVLGVDLASRMTEEHAQVVAEFLDQMASRDSRDAIAFAAHAGRVGNWEGDLARLRFAALQSGLSR